MDQAIKVRSVWASNLEHEFCLIRTITEEGRYTRATLDTEFWLASDTMNMNDVHPLLLSPDERYHAIRMRTDEGRIRQLGLTLSADDGSVLVWEFNFGPFHSPEEMQNGYFGRMQHDGIHSIFFSELLLSSGLVYNNRITWTLFHSAYDIIFFIKLATFWSPLPESLVEFKFWVWTYLGERILDVKYIIKFTPNLYGGLKEVAAALGIERVVGHAHQAGSDSLLTWYTYKRMADIYFPHDGGMRHAGVLYGIDAI